MKNNMLVVTYLYPFPNKELKKSGIFLHNSLVNLSKIGININVVLYIPLVPSILKKFSFNLRTFAFEKYEVDGITVYPVPYIMGLSKWLRLDLKLKCLLFKTQSRIIKRDGFIPQMIYGPFSYPDGPLAQKIADIFNIPFWTTMRGSDIHTHCRNNITIRKHLQAVFKKAKLVTAVSERLQKEAGEIFNEDYVSDILYTVCNTDTFKKLKPISKNLNRYIFIGALVRTKGVFEIAKLFKRIIKEKPDSTLTFVGKGSEREQLEILLKKDNLYDKVKFTGLISSRVKLVDIINEHDILLFPSHKEGLPNVVVEHIACERIVMTTDVGGVKEIAPQNAAYKIIEVKNISLMLNAIHDIQNTNYEELVKATQINRNILIEKFSEKAQLLKLKQIIEKI